MKVELSAVHKLTVTADCGCKMSGEFEDAAYTKAVGEPTFAGCAAHAEVPSTVELISGLLRQVFNKEAAAVVSPDPLPPPMQEQPRPRIALRPPSSAPTAAATGPTGRPTLAAVNGTAPGTETRTPIRTARQAAPEPGGHRPPERGTGQARVVGGGGVRRVDPNAALAKRGVGPRIANAPAAASLEIDMDSAPEDSRVTALLESSGLLDGDDDGEV